MGRGAHSATNKRINKSINTFLVHMSDDMSEMIERMQRCNSSNLSEFEIPEPPCKKRKVLTSGLLSALDRTATSNEAAAHIIAETTLGLGHSLDEIVMSPSTIRRSRVKHRTKFTANLKRELHFAPYLEAHFDGKILKDIVGKEKVDRFPVVVTGLETSHLLGVPKLRSGTGVNQADAVIEVLSEWNVQNRIKSMCFDTTTTNTGMVLLKIF